MRKRDTVESQRERERECEGGRACHRHHSVSPIVFLPLSLSLPLSSLGLRLQPRFYERQHAIPLAFIRSRVYYHPSQDELELYRCIFTPPAPCSSIRRTTNDPRHTQWFKARESESSAINLYATIRHALKASDRIKRRQPGIFTCVANVTIMEVKKQAAKGLLFLFSLLSRRIIFLHFFLKGFSNVKFDGTAFLHQEVVKSKFVDWTSCEE